MDEQRIEILRKINPQVTDSNGCMDIRQQFDLWRKRKFDRNNSMIVAESSRELGLSFLVDAPVVIHTKTIVKCRGGKQGRHFLNNSFFWNLKEDMKNHFFAMDSKMREDTIILIEKRRDYKGDPVIVCLAKDKCIRDETVHIITSMYGRRGFGKWLNDSLNKGCQIYVNQNKGVPGIDLGMLGNKKEKEQLNRNMVQSQRERASSFSGFNYILGEEKSQGKGKENIMENITEKTEWKGFVVYLTNLEKYAEGRLVGRSIHLPASQKEITETMEKIGLTKDSGEYFIPVYDMPQEWDFLQNSFSEYSRLEDLNMIAALIEKYNPNPYVLQALSEDRNMTLQELGNAIVQNGDANLSKYGFEELYEKAGMKMPGSEPGEGLYEELLESEPVAEQIMETVKEIEEKAPKI